MSNKYPYPNDVTRPCYELLYQFYEKFVITTAIIVIHTCAVNKLLMQI